MNILITGAKGFMGQNLIANLQNLTPERSRNIKVDSIMEFNIDTPEEMLDEFCKKADFVFNFAGVMRPKDDSEFEKDNHGFSDTLLNYLRKHNNTCPVMLASSTQAALVGRFEGSLYGQSKLAAENLMFEYSQKTGAKVLVYRFTNAFGKWGKPNYNSAIATFCHNIARDLPITVNDRKTELELVHIDDIVNEMLDALEGKEHRCNYDGLDRTPCEDGKFTFVPVTHRATLGEIVDLLYSFRAHHDNFVIPQYEKGSFEAKLFSTYISFLPKERMENSYIVNEDARGSFTELFKFKDYGQFSVNVSKPGITKGQHWHNSKWELFIVVSGHGLIQKRKIGSDEIIEFEVSGDEIKPIYMIPGYTHNIINLSETENLVTVMWANEQFDKNHPDTFGEAVVKI